MPWAPCCACTFCPFNPTAKPANLGMEGELMCSCSLDSTEVYFLVFWAVPIGIILLVGTIFFAASVVRLVQFAPQLTELKKLCGTYFLVIPFIFIQYYRCLYHSSNGSLLVALLPTPQTGPIQQHLSREADTKLLQFSWKYKEKKERTMMVITTKVDEDEDREEVVP